MNGLNKKTKMVSLSIGLLLIMMFIYIILCPGYFYKPDGKYRIAFAGRSVMGQWFKSWNWPSIINKYAVWRPWPIPYSKYVKDGYYFEYLAMVEPNYKSKDDGYGKGMLDSIRKGIKGKTFDALFFKYCFVDFDDRTIMDENSKNARFKQMTSLVKDVEKFTMQEHMKLMLGNALPSLEPTIYGQQLRLEYNKWLEEYQTLNNNVIIVDLYGQLAEKNGKLKAALARDSSDSHINLVGYDVLNRELWRKIKLLKNLSFSTGNSANSP